MKNKTNNKKKNKGYISLLLLLLTISLFVTSTYALFTDSAYVYGNKAFSGNMYVDVISSEETLRNSRHYDFLNWVADYDDIDTVFAEWNDKETDDCSIEAYAMKFDEWHASNPDKKFADYLESIGIIAKEYFYDKVYDAAENTLFSVFATDELGFKLYKRQLKSMDFDNYYIITDKDARAINLYNVEPGSLHYLDIEYINTGNLAFKTVGAIKIDKVLDAEGNEINKSYTGLETLNKQIDFTNPTALYQNNFVVTPSPSSEFSIDPSRSSGPFMVSLGNLNGAMSQKIQTYSIKNGFELNPDDTTSDNNKKAFEEYNVRYDNLFAKQSTTENNGGDFIKHATSIKEDKSGIDYETTSYYDNGGKLENILEVYFIPQFPDNNTSNAFSQNTMDLSTEERNFVLNKESGYFFGNLLQFDFLMNYGEVASSTFPYDTYENYTDDQFNTLKEKYETNPNDLSYEEQYMVLYDNPKAKLYNDYQRYINLASGYCIPADDVVDPATHFVKDNIRLKIYKNNIQVDEEKASEIGKTRIALYMPLYANSTYENASISLSLGVTATQVEYEMDDTGCMIYDKDASTAISDILYEKGDVLNMNLNDNSTSSIARIMRGLDLRILDIEGDLATCLVNVPQYYLSYSNSDDGICDFIKDSNNIIKYDGTVMKNGVDTTINQLLFDENFKDLFVKFDYAQKQYELHKSPKLSSLLTDDNDSYTLYVNSDSYKFTPINECTPIQVYARPLEISDIFKFFGNDELDYNDVKKIVYGGDTGLNILKTQAPGKELYQLPVTLTLPIFNVNTYLADSFIATYENEDVDEIPCLAYLDRSGDLYIANGTQDHPDVQTNVTLVVKLNLSKLENGNFMISKKFETEEFKDYDKIFDVGLINNTSSKISNNIDLIESGLLAGMKMNPYFNNLSNYSKINVNTYNDETMKPFIDAKIYFSFDNVLYKGRTVFNFTVDGQNDYKCIEKGLNILLSGNKRNSPLLNFIGIIPSDGSGKPKAVANSPTNYIGTKLIKETDIFGKIIEFNKSAIQKAKTNGKNLSVLILGPNENVSIDYFGFANILNSEFDIDYSDQMSKEMFIYGSNPFTEVSAKLDSMSANAPDLIISFDKELSKQIKNKYSYNVLTVSPTFTNEEETKALLTTVDDGFIHFDSDFELKYLFKIIFDRHIANCKNGLNTNVGEFPIPIKMDVMD